MTLVDKGAFDTLTAAEWNELLGLVRNPYVKKSAIQTINNVASLTPDTQLTLPITRINTTFTFQLWMIINSGTVPDFKFGWLVPSGATMSWSAMEGSTSIVAAAMQGPFTEASVVPINGTGSDQVIKADGQLTIAGNVGSFALQWSQNTATASNTSVKSGSFVQLWPV